MNFVVDAQLPPGLCIRLRQLGHEAMHVLDLGLVGANDAEIADATVAGERVLITKDEDFYRFDALIVLQCCGFDVAT